MSDTVKVIVITEQKHMELSGAENGKYSDERREVTHPTGMTLMSTLLKEKLIDGSFCGGRGDCGRCMIQFIGAAPLPSGIERSVMKPEELRKGYRLACMARPRQNCTIRLALRSEEEMDVVTHISPLIEMSEEIDYISQQIEGKCSAASHIMAVDLGTTTIAMQLVEMASGRIVDTCAKMNPQRRFGSDVLSRIQAAADGYAWELKDCLWQVLEEGLKQFEKTLANLHHETDLKTAETVQINSEKTERVQTKRNAVPPRIDLISIAGNTTMEHLFMGLSTASLGRSPFTPVDIGLQKTSWKGIPVYVLPGISAFVGGDIVAGLYACGMLSGKTGGVKQLDSMAQTDYAEQPAAILLIDLGTNGELVLKKGDQMLAAATAAGPAFEGGAGSTVIGSDMIAIADALLAQGIMDESGLLKEPFFTEGVSVQRNGQPVYMTKEDIRSLQMAKAAVRTGIELLAERMHCAGKKDCDEKIQAYLAGGFGYYLDVDAAMRTGLLPKSMQGSVRAVGNTSLAGAYLLGRALWLGIIEEEALHKELMQIKSINLAKLEDFNKRYISNLNFN